MAWYDTALDAASVAFPLTGIGIQAGKAIGNLAQGKATSFFDIDSSYTPPAPPGAVGRPTQVRKSQREAFNPMRNPRIAQSFNPYNAPGVRGVNKAAAAYANYGQNKERSADEQLMLGYNAPRPVDVQNVTPQAVNAATAYSEAGLNRANNMLDRVNQSRGMGVDVYGTAMRGATGKLPLAGENMANEAGVIAGEQFLRAGSEANQAYGLAQNTAGQAYSDALAQQVFQTQLAGRQAGRQTQDAAEQAILQQAALAAGARGGNIGLALRGAQQGAAMQSQAANVQAARLMSDADAQAAYLAATGQRQASAQQAAANLATQGTQERAAFAAASAEEQARFRAAEIAAQAQQGYLGLAQGAASDVRQGDVAGVNAATGIANTGVNVDQMVNAVNTGNADRDLAGQQFNASQWLQNQQFGQQMGLSYDQLNSGNLNNVANRGASAAQFGLGMQGNFAGMSAQGQQQLALQQIMGNQALAQLFVGLDEASKQRMLDAYIAQQGAATARRGQNIGIFGGAAGGVGAGVAGAMLSDRRAKRDIKREGSPDFRGAGHYSYRYKDPSIPGAAPGKHKGPMAQELPKDVLRRGDDGLLRVDIGRLALSLASAVGELQRKAG